MVQFKKTSLRALALFVTFLWSTSFIIIKTGLVEMPPITFAGLRYFIACLFLMPFMITEKYKAELKRLKKYDLLKLLLLGLVFYTFTQGAQFIGLSLLPSVTVSLMLNFTPLIVAVLSVFIINEKPTIIQWMGTVIFICGIILYFYPVSNFGNQKIGFVVMMFAVVSNALSSILGRNINRQQKISPIVVTYISMGMGSIFLLLIGMLTEGFISISSKNIIAIFWLAIVNTAFAFTLWNYTLQKLSAIESSIINGTMLIQIALLAWIFLGESITLLEFIGMLIAAMGAFLIQVKRIRKESI